MEGTLGHVIKNPSSLPFGLTKSSAPANGVPQIIVRRGYPRPRIYAPRTSVPSSDLCEQCQRMDFLEMFEYRRADNVRQMEPGIFDLLPTACFEVRYLPEMSQNSNCALCQYFLQVADQKLSFPEEFWNQAYLCMVPALAADVLMLTSLFGPGYTTTYLILWIDTPQTGIYIGSSTFRSRTWLGLSRIGLSGGCSKFSRRRERPSLVDLKRVKSWIRICDSRHGTRCQSSTEKRIFNLHLIDVQKAAVIPAPEGATYVALSYVWGETLQNQRGRMGHLGQLPQTVEDAMKVTAAIGEHYLWVDAYCLGHEDSPERSLGLRQMHRIYSNALLTILALSNRSADDGLPGMGLRSDTSGQFTDTRITLGDEEIVCFAPKPLAEHFREAFWNTRGWTLQEAYFSRRRLCFTEDETFLWCGESLFYSSIINREEGNASKWDYAKTLEPFGLPPMAKYVKGRFDFESYASLVELYRKRNLTFESDSLAAFEGILAHIEEQRGMTFLFGLPNCHDFWKSLAWEHRRMVVEHRNTPSRIKQVPSWSWAGWSGPVTYQYVNLLRHPSHPIRLLSSQLSSGQISVYASAVSANLIPWKRGEYCLQTLGNAQKMVCLNTRGLYNYFATQVLTASPCDFDDSELQGSGKLLEAILIAGAPTYGQFVVMLLEVVHGVAYRLGIVEVDGRGWSALLPVQKRLILG